MSGEVVAFARHDLRRGDCVRSRAGGPLMLVAVADAGIWAHVQCIWVTPIPGGRLQIAEFLGSSLDLVARCAAP